MKDLNYEVLKSVYCGYVKYYEHCTWQLLFKAHGVNSIDEIIDEVRRCDSKQETTRLINLSCRAFARDLSEFKSYYTFLYNNPGFRMKPTKA